MKSILHQAALATAAVLSFCGVAQANDIVIYKHTDSRPWVQYTCIRPTSTDPVNPAVPQTNIVGKYTQTEWWIYDATASTMRKITFWSQPILGGKPSKRYEVGPEVVWGNAYAGAAAASDTNVEMFILTNKAGIFKHSMLEAIDSQDDVTDLDGDSNDDFQRLTQRQNLLGDAKLLKVSKAPVLNFPRIATTLSGDWRYTEDTQLLDVGGAALFRRQIMETGKPKLTLDLPKTKLANQGGPITAYYGGAAQSAGNSVYAIILLENELYKLGYDKD
jgi:hypothetical protein